MSQSINPSLESESQRRWSSRCSNCDTIREILRQTRCHFQCQARSISMATHLDYPSTKKSSHSRSRGLDAAQDRRSAQLEASHMGVGVRRSDFCHDLVDVTPLNWCFSQVHTPRLHPKHETIQCQSRGRRQCYFACIYPGPLVLPSSRLILL